MVHGSQLHLSTTNYGRSHGVCVKHTISLGFALRFPCTAIPADCPEGSGSGGHLERPCLGDPCLSASCPNHPFATCRANYCDGCIAEFFVGSLKVACEGEHASTCCACQRQPWGIRKRITKPISHSSALLGQY